MKNTLRLKKQLRARRKKQSKRQTLSLEQLEPKQLLSASMAPGQLESYPGDLNAPDLNIYFSDYNRATISMPFITRRGFKAPWADGGGQGYDAIHDWTTQQDLSSRASNEFTIDTIEEYSTYLSNGEVAEVSDKLVACFYQSNTSNDPKITPAGISTLYPGHQIENAWVGSSANLYDLLVLNQRFPRLLGPGGLPPTASARGGNGSLYGIGAPGDTDSSTLQPTPTFSGLVSDKALQGLTRIVGFAFGGGDGTFPNPVAATAGNIPALAVFNHEDGIFTPASAKAGSTDHVYSLPDFVPTLRAFFQQTNDGRPLLLGSDSGRVRPLPAAVLEKLESWYAEGITQPKDPLKIFSEISGITHLGEIWSKYPPVYPGAPYDVYQHPVASPSIPIALQQTGANYTVYKEACEVVRGYYLDWKNNNPPAQNGGGTPYTNEQAIEMFFNGFVEHRLVQLDAIDPVLDPVIYDSAINDLAVGLRALMAMSYDASPLWSSYGVGYSNAANPMVGKTYDEIAATSNPIEILSGQEFQLQNVQLPSNYLNVTGQNPVQTGPIGGQNSYPKYPSGGWFDLQEPAPPLNGINYISNIPDNDFTTNYTIGSTKTSVIFPSDSLSSNTLSAAGLSGAGDLFTRDSIARDDLVGESTSQTFKELSGLTYHEDILEEGFSFATHISLAGGVDLVTGSQFSDVIVGPGHGVDDLPNKEFHGRLNVDAGAGDDIVAPGRGGSLVILGEGADKVVFGHSDLFGETNFLDFNFEQGDRLFVDHRITVDTDYENPDKLILRNFKGDKKILRLTGANDRFWNTEAIVKVDYSIAGDSDVTLNYLEVHNFWPDNPHVFDPMTYSTSGEEAGVNLVIDVGAKTPPASVAVSIGNQTLISSRDAQNKHVIWLGEGSQLGNEIKRLGPTNPLNFSLTSLDVDNQNFAFGAQQYQVSLNRTSNGYMMDKWYDNSTDFTNLTTANPDTHTSWRIFSGDTPGKYRVGYVGGLANWLLDNPNNSNPIQIHVNSYGEVETGQNSFNLSSRIALYQTELDLSVATSIVTEGNNQPTTTRVTLPSEIGQAGSFRAVSLMTEQPVRVVGSGIISGKTIVNYAPYLNARAENRVDTDPYYCIDSDMLAVSSSWDYKNGPHTTGGYEPAVEVAGISIEWPATRGYGPMILQDFNQVVVAEVDQNSYPKISLPPLGIKGANLQNFGNSPARVYDYKQLGGWVSQADGPTIGGQDSYFVNSFIHSNDDSVKVVAPYTHVENITVLQGGAGNAVSFGYGFQNTGVGGSTIEGIYVHRISQGSSNTPGLVTARLVPSSVYNDTNFIIGDLKNPQAITVYVPDLGVEKPAKAMNRIECGTTIFVENSYSSSERLPQSNSQSPVFEIGGIKTEFYLYKNTVPKAAAAFIQIGGTNVSTASGTVTFSDTQFPLANYSNPKTITIKQNGVLNFWGPAAQIQRPKLRRSSKILVHRTGELEGKMGPSPVVLAYSTLADATLEGTRDSGTSNTFVVSKVASGYVEKKRSDGSWVDVSTPPKTSSPRALLQLLRNRMITPSDEIRWVPGTANEGKASAEAFSLYGWDGVSASVEASEIEVGVE